MKETRSFSLKPEAYRVRSASQKFRPIGASIVQERVIVGIDVGTTKICVLVGELDRDGKLNIVGVGTCPSQGLSRGVVVNIEETVTSIAAALDRAERLSGKRILSAYVGIDRKSTRLNSSHVSESR